jgi:sodium transport system permease protein
MQTANVVTIFKKELVDTLRDRRTLIFMLLIPIVAIPLLMMGVSSLMVGQITKLQGEKSEIVIQGKEYLPSDLQDILSRAGGMSIVTPDAYAGKDLMEELKQQRFQVLVVVKETFGADIQGEQPTDLQVYYDKSDIKSDFAYERISETLAAYKDQIVQQRLKQRGVPAGLITPFDVKEENITPPQKMLGKQVGPMLPYVIIIMCFMGAMYPAIDLAAGEKERGTLETLLVSPATRGEFVVGKYLVILLTGVVAALLSLGSLVFSINYMVTGMVEELSKMMVAIEFNFQTVILVLLIILPLAGIFAGILLSISIFARTFKEAQSYVTALNMVIILPAFVALLPGVKLSFTLALIPVVNASMIINEAIIGTIEWQYVVAAMLANGFLAGLALLFSRYWFERETVLFRQ